MQLRAAIDDRIGFVMQGNSSAVAVALVAAIDKQNVREPDRRVLFLNYSADDPALTNGARSFWHFRFDAHAGMRMDALADALKDDRSLKKVYLLNQDYSFGHDVSREAQRALKERRPDIAIAGDEFHPIGRVKDFAPYIAKIRASAADAVIIGNWGNDLMLLVKAAREQGLDTKFYTFYGNGLGAPAALGDAGVKRVIAVADWHPNAAGAASNAYYAAFRARRHPAASDDYLVARMPLMVEMLAAAMTRAGSADPLAVARVLEGMKFDGEGFHPSMMHAEDHQLVQPLYVMEMDRAGTPGVRFDNEGSATASGRRDSPADDLQDDAPGMLGRSNRRSTGHGTVLCSALRFWRSPRTPNLQVFRAGQKRRRDLKCANPRHGLSSVTACLY